MESKLSSDRQPPRRSGHELDAASVRATMAPLSSGSSSGGGHGLEKKDDHQDKAPLDEDEQFQESMSKFFHEFHRHIFNPVLLRLAALEIREDLSGVPKDPPPPLPPQRD
eukprot:TRINITY_DN5864_c2_g1_i1.p1 TRINITY_DN5864_c2_g1~~TRINITY_DN5864_c2_g1_i1.p1  ORF type:complete len:110 (-),score=30.33 TRINITY_DN5864_c2_g1_i1:38-367(-)